jgi:hypothetical protein
VVRTLEKADWFHPAGFPVATERRDPQRPFGLHAHEFADFGFLGTALLIQMVEHLLQYSTAVQGSATKPPHPEEACKHSLAVSGDASGWSVNRCDRVRSLLFSRGWVDTL